MVSIQFSTDCAGWWNLSTENCLAAGHGFEQPTRGISILFATLDGGAKNCILCRMYILIAAIMFAMSLHSNKALAVCGGDCSGDGEITVDELVLGVNIALGSVDIDQCNVFDTDSDGEVTIAELIAAVNSLLNGCPALQPTPTATPNAQPTPTSASATPGINCNNGAWDVTYTNVDAGTNATTSEHTLDLVTGLFGSAVLALDGNDCPQSGPHLDRSIQLSYIGIASLAPGSYPLDTIIRTLVYGENAPPNTIHIWRASSGTLVIDSVEGKRLTFHLTAAMAPFPYGYSGGPPVGTFTLNVSGVVDAVGP